MIAQAKPFDCKELLRNKGDRDEMLINAVIFQKGNFFWNNGASSLSLSEARAYYKRNENALISNLRMQGVRIIGFPVGSGILKIAGGPSRLGRVAKLLKEKYRTDILFDLSVLADGQNAMYSRSKNAIYINLKEIIYPNQISVSLFHEIRHLVIDQRAAFIPQIRDERISLVNYKKFRLDEVLAHKNSLDLLMNRSIEKESVDTYKEFARKQAINQRVGTLLELSGAVLNRESDLLAARDLFIKLAEHPESLRHLLSSGNHVPHFDTQPGFALVRSHAFGQEPLPQARPFASESEWQVFVGSQREYEEMVRERCLYSARIIDQALQISHSFVAAEAMLL